MAFHRLLLGFDHPHCIYDQDFGLSLTPDDILLAAATPLLSRDYYRPWRQSSAGKDVGSTVRNDKDKFQVKLDVQHYTPEDISVRIANGYIVIEGKHEEREDAEGFISRHFTRKYVLPDGCDPEVVESQLSSDGILTVVAPRVMLGFNERTVPITQTGPVRKDIKDQDSQVDSNGI